MNDVPTFSVGFTDEHVHFWQYATRLVGFDVLLVCDCGELLRKTIPDASVVDLASLLDRTDALPEDALDPDASDHVLSVRATAYASGWSERRQAIEAAAGR